MAKGLGFTLLLALLPTALGQLNIAARIAGKKYFGTATNEYQFNDARYLAQLNNTYDFAQLTPVRDHLSLLLVAVYCTDTSFLGQCYEMGWLNAA